MRHLTASRALAPAFNQRQPARLNRLPTTRSLAANGALQPSLFDERDMAEIKCPERFLGERLVVCRKPLLAEERTRQHRELIAATVAELMAARRAVRPGSTC